MEKYPEGTLTVPLMIDVFRWCSVLLLVTACGGSAANAPRQLAPWLRADPHRCLIGRDLREGMETMARRCAEAFVQENGYTDLPATADSSRWVLEAGEHGEWARVLAARGGSLGREAATVQCSVQQCLVFFRLHRAPQRCAYRIVTMSQVFTRLQVEPGGVHDVRCQERRA